RHPPPIRHTHTLPLTPRRPPPNHTWPCSFCPWSSTTSLYPLSLHDALPISRNERFSRSVCRRPRRATRARRRSPLLRRIPRPIRSEEHTSELQSREKLVCRLLLEKNTTDRTSCTDRPSPYVDTAGATADTAT